MKEKIKVILTDDHKIIRDGIRALLQEEEFIKVVGEASNGEELVHMLESETADVVLLDINMPGESGLNVTVTLKERYPNLKVLILSMHSSGTYAIKAMESGASGYLLKSAGREELVSALRLVATGAIYISPHISLGLLYSRQAEHVHDNANPEQEQRIELSKREIEILHLIAEGYTNAEIAEKLFNSKRTIETHRQNLLEKTKCKNTASLIKYAFQNGII